MVKGSTAAAGVREGELLWAPSEAQVERTNVTAFTKWLERKRGLRFRSYEELWNWSVSDLESFWGALWDYFEIQASAPYARVMGKSSMPGAEWFPGARLNYAEHILRRERPGTDAVLCFSEAQPLTGMPWETFAGEVRILATRLRELGVRPGDRVAACLPNVPQTMIAMFATTAIGAIWVCCSPDFGARGVIDRFQQLSPKVLFCVDGYRYGGKAFDRTKEVAEIVGALKELRHVIYLPNLDPRSREVPCDEAISWSAIMERGP
ncbi:MAG TPA: AMP-binding protein, partial [Candidatus Acidoferrum sp.]|nr:AMP-binding protein [Candidatus Acidoferrum sp.]